MPEDTTPRGTEPPEPEPAERPTGERLTAEAALLTCISLLASKAWEALGLIPDPVTKKVERHLEEAQLAIDAAAALVDIMRSRVPDAERRELETLITNLRVNFVEQRARG